MKLYLAAPLFSEAERAFNLALADALSAAGHEVYLPQRDTPNVDGTARTTAIFRANLAAVAKADAVVAVCEGPQVDDGTAWEIGYAYGRNIPVYGLRTDARRGQQHAGSLGEAEHYDVSRTNVLRSYRGRLPHHPEV